MTIPLAYLDLVLYTVRISKVGLFAPTNCVVVFCAVFGHGLDGAS